MPNWITGSLKVRGSFENVKKFFTENVNRYIWEWNEKEQKSTYKPVPKEKWLEVKEYDPSHYEGREIDIYYKLVETDWVYVEETRRAFISSDCIYIYENKLNEPVVAYCEINQAWGFDPEDWIELSKKFNVDIRLWGLECGMGFGQEIEVIKGELTINKEIVYKDWNWECPLPWMGG